MTERSESTSLSSGDEPAIRQLYQQLLACWNKRDGAAFAQLFAVDGNVVGFDGSQIDGQAAVAEHLGAIFANHQTSAYVGKIREVRFLTEEVALLRAVVGMVPPGQSDINPAVNAIQTLIAVKHSDVWQIALFQNTPAQFHGQPALAEALTAELRALLSAER